MAGKALPIDFKNKSKDKRSNEYFDKRLKHEEKMKIGKQEFIITEEVLKKKEAIKKWNEIVKIYDGFEFVSDIDIGVIEKYCITHAEFIELLHVAEGIRNQGMDEIKTYHALDKLKYYSNYNKIVDTLTKLEDRLFLNPLARLRNIPRFESEDNKDNYLDILGFGNI